MGKNPKCLSFRVVGVFRGCFHFRCRGDDGELEPLAE